MDLMGTVFSGLLGTHTTYLLIHKMKMNSIRASTLTTILFGVLHLATPTLILPQFLAAFFGGTFVAMNEPHRLGERLVLLAGFIFSVFYLLLVQTHFTAYFGGLGGTLGATAFIASLITFYFQKKLKDLVKPSRPAL